MFDRVPIYLTSEICQNSEYSKALNDMVLHMQALHNVLNMTEYALTEF